jgi:hypothetical protein
MPPVGMFCSARDNQDPAPLTFKYRPFSSRADRSPVSRRSSRRAFAILCKPDGSGYAPSEPLSHFSLHRSHRTVQGVSRPPSSTIAQSKPVSGDQFCQSRGTASQRALCRAAAKLSRRASVIGGTSRLVLPVTRSQLTFRSVSALAILHPEKGDPMTWKQSSTRVSVSCHMNLCIWL